jgi:hypothetical protein
VLWLCSGGVRTCVFVCFDVKRVGTSWCVCHVHPVHVSLPVHASLPVHVSFPVRLHKKVPSFILEWLVADRPCLARWCDMLHLWFPIVCKHLVCDALQVLCAHASTIRVVIEHALRLCLKSSHVLQSRHTFVLEILPTLLTRYRNMSFRNLTKPI